MGHYIVIYLIRMHQRFSMAKSLDKREIANMIYPVLISEIPLLLFPFEQEY